MTFSVKDEWATNPEAIFTQYHNVLTKEYDCVMADIVQEKVVTYEAHCMESVPITVVDLWVAGTSNSSGDNAVVPDCCHPDSSIHSNNVVHYTFEIRCVTEC